MIGGTEETLQYILQVKCSVLRVTEVENFFLRLIKTEKKDKGICDINALNLTCTIHSENPTRCSPVDL
jgi:hypothetical protein